jgi:hypothetical protein
MTKRGWAYFFDRRIKSRRLFIIWEAFPVAVKAVYTATAKIGAALGTLFKASIQHAYSVFVKPMPGTQTTVRAQTTYTGVSAGLRGRAYGLTARASYVGTSASLKGRPYGLLDRISYTAKVGFGARSGISARTSYSGASVSMKGSPAGFRAQARYSASTRQSATSGTKFGTLASYSASASAEVNPSWLPKFNLTVDKSAVNTLPGATYSITFTVTNVGGLTAQAEVSVWDVDVTLKDQLIVTLDPNASYSRTVSFTAPQDPGTYYVTAQVKNLFTQRADGTTWVQVNVAPSQ